MPSNGSHTQSGTHSSSSTIDLLTGHPTANLLPHRLLQASAHLALSDDRTWAGPDASDLDPTDAMQYGPPEGDITVRRALAALLTRLNGPSSSSSFPVDPSCIMLTGGASMTLVWLLLAFTQPKGYTRRIFMPSATFHLTFPTLRDVGYTLPSDVKSTGEAADVEGIREDSEGIDVEALERRLLELDAEEVHTSRAGRKIFRYALYLVPTFSNPTGIVLSAARRERLVQLAVRHDILIICDDVYDYLYYSESYKNRHPSRLSAVDKAFGQGQNVVSNGSFSKILAPGTRFGWLECHPKLLQQILTNGALNSGGGPAHLSSRLVLPLLLPSALPILLPYLSQGSSSSSSGITAIERHISDIRLVYTDRLAAMLKAICVSLLPLGCSLPLGEPQGGYFLWMELPGDVPEDAFAKECEMEQVVVGLGSWFLVNVSSYTAKGEKAAVRFCWAFNDETRLREGIERVARAIRVVQGVHLN